jgi:multiple sugar transport system ATP-binding protein
MDVRLQHISKSFGSVQAVKEVSLHFAEREFITLLGPSGCGKTTILRMIAGLEKPTSGQIYFGDRIVNHLAPGDRNVAMVFQSYALYPHMTVFNNIGYGLKVHKIPAAEITERVNSVARILEIDHLLRRKPRELSGGQRQRVALGRAMVRKPAIFLMDEPLSNLDARLRVSMRTELKRFHMRLETTTIYVTHDQLEAMTMSDKIAVIDQGEVRQFGTPAEIYNQPANLFVAGFIGNPPMNFLEGALTRADRPALQINSIRQPLPPRFEAALAHYPEGKKLILGIRAEDIVVINSDGERRIAAQVAIVELVGSEKLVELTLPGNQRLVAEVKAEDPIATDQWVNIDLNLKRVHVFDADSGRAVAPA